MDKEKLREFIESVDSILCKEWDPIGCGCPDDEYTSYALIVAGKVWNGEDKQVILDYLYTIENENMGLRCKKEQADLTNAPVVDKIIELAKKYKV